MSTHSDGVGFLPPRVRSASLALVMILQAALVSVSAASAPEPEQRLYRAALDQFDRARYVESLQGFTDLLYRNPEGPLADSARQYIWKIVSRIKEAESRARITPEERREAVRLALQQQEARRKQAQELLGELEDVRRATKSDPRDLVSALWRSRQLSDPSRAAVAQELEALKAQDRLDEIRNALQVRLQQGQFSDPKLQHEARGFLALYQGDLDGAVGEWTAATELDPKDDALRAALEQTREELKRQKREEAIQDRLAEAKDYFAVGELGKARESFNALLRLEPDHAEAARSIALIDTRLDERRRQQTVLQKLEQARGLLEKNAFLEAASSLVEALELDPKNERALYYLDAVKKRLAARTALTAGPRKSRPKGAAAPSRDRAEAEEAYTLGMAKYVQNELGEAVRLFELALSLDPTFEEAARAADAARREKGAR